VTVARKPPTRLSLSALVRCRWLPGSAGFCLVVEPAIDRLDPAGWAAGARSWIEATLLEAGALLFRGFALTDLPAFCAFLGAAGDPLLDYPERAATRQEVAPRVFTSTELAADQEIPLHHEMSYCRQWPGKLWFYCQRPPRAGGATPIASERAVTASLPQQIRAPMLERRLMYVRNYGDGFDSWQTVFQSDNRAQVEAYCHRAGLSCEWRGEERLRTRAIRPAMVSHPRTGEALWFNHAALFHESNLPPAVRQDLRRQFRPEEMPRNAFYGDGGPIDDQVVAALRAAYHLRAVRFDWLPGDVLMLDNVLAAHGREPFSGARSILVAMAELSPDGDPVPEGAWS
jgi:alpha-ketoglutarate-dependent taurine dioxygenase